MFTRTALVLAALLVPVLAHAQADEPTPDCVVSGPLLPKSICDGGAMKKVTSTFSPAGDYVVRMQLAPLGEQMWSVPSLRTTVQDASRKMVISLSDSLKTSATIVFTDLETNKPLWGCVKTPALDVECGAAVAQVASR